MCRPGRPCARCDLLPAVAVHPVDAPMGARTGAGLMGAAIQKRALAASIAMAAVAAPVAERLGEIPANWATADFPRPPYRLRSVFYDEAVRPGDDTGNAPTRTDRLNDLLGGL